MRQRKRQRVTHVTRHGFTIIELMVVVSLIIVLLSLIIVALNRSQRAAQRINTQALMHSITQALIQFREDVGYLPPILDENRDLMEPPSLNPGTFDTEIQDWHSSTTLADYLIGYGPESADGYGNESDATIPSPGIRHPGSDGVWEATLYGAQDGSFGARNSQLGSGGLGKILGPYLQLDNPRLLVAIDFSVDPPRILNPGDPGYDDPQFPKALADYWGRPIQYFRRAYPPGAISQSYRAVDRTGDGVVDPVPALSNVILLRPQLARENTLLKNARTIGDELIDLTTMGLQTAEFALFSSGPDLRFNRDSRIDEPGAGSPPGQEYSNADNIVEVSK